MDQTKSREAMPSPVSNLEPVGVYGVTNMTLSHAAIQALKVLIADHPEDPFVRVSLQDLDDQRLLFSITLEAELKPDDERIDCEGLTVGVEGRNAPRMQGVTLDYQEGEGFTFLHPAGEDDGREGLGRISLN